MIFWPLLLLSFSAAAPPPRGRQEPMYFDDEAEKNASQVISLNGQLRSVFLDGDMIINRALMRELQRLKPESRRKRWAYKDNLYPGTIWEDGVPYEFDAELPQSARNSLTNAMKFWEWHTCVNFRPRENETEYILFTGENQGCFSTVGRDETQLVQPVNIGRGCYHFGVTTHEVGHAIGLFHHQQRYDRDDYVSFEKQEVAKKYWMNFAKIPQKYLDTYGLPYDVGSIMHYTPTEFASNVYMPSLMTKDGNLQGTMGSMDGPSFLDVLIVNRHYKCQDGCNSTEIKKPKCINGGYPNPRNCTICKCPSGFGGDVCQLISTSAPLKCGGLIPTSSKLTRMRIRLVSTGSQRRQCVYHIRAPPNRRVMIGLQSVDATCQEGCYTSAVEMKMIGDYRPVGYRFCCESHSFRRMLSKGRNVPIIFYARNSTLDVVLHFRWGVEMTVLQPPSDLTAPGGDSATLEKAAFRGRPSFDDDSSNFVGEYGSDGESYEDFSHYS
ncbi:hypothetical protein Q1695_013266 [Nippostrongylus brasiliensis]|nr:hypothetical protein Q1695_013266 [Nippostrongylus brasiliensis]